MAVLTIPGSIPTKKNRQRIGVIHGRPMIYKPKVVKDFERLVAEEILAQRCRQVVGKFSISVLLVYEKHEPDLDGTITTILDACQDAGLFENDRDMVRIHDSEKRRSVSKDDPPRAIITFATV